MRKEVFLEIGKDIQGFEIINPQNVPEGLTAQILWNLWDIGVKFGSFFKKGIGFKNSPLYMELYNFRGDDSGGAAGMFIAKIRPSHLTDEGALLFELRNGMHIIWDRGFTVADIQEIIKKVDDHARLEGMIVDGNRLPIIDKGISRSAKMSVNMFFKNKGAIMPIFPDMDVNQVLNDFDRPDLLDVIDSGLLKLVCLKSEKDRLITEYQEKMRRLSEMGINRSDIAKMPIEELLALKKKL